LATPRVAFNQDLPKPTDSSGTAGTGIDLPTAVAHDAGSHAEHAGQPVTIPQQGAVEMGPTHEGHYQSHGQPYVQSHGYAPGHGYAQEQVQAYGAPCNGGCNTGQAYGVAMPSYQGPAYSAPTYSTPTYSHQHAPIQATPVSAPVYQEPAYSYSAAPYGGSFDSSVGACGSCGNYGCNGGCSKLANLGTGVLKQAACGIGGYARSGGWFGGLYYLNLKRDDDNVGRPLAHGVGYEESIALSSGQARMDNASGLGVRVGKMLDSCSALEFLYWQVFPGGEGGLSRSGPGTYHSGVNDGDYTWSQSASYLGYNLDAEAGYQSLLSPSGAALGNYYNDVQLLEVRRNFDYRNFELNFLRLPFTFNGSDCSKASFAFLGGVRYFRADEEMSLFSDQQNEMPGDDPANEFVHLNQIDNHLVGFQLGSLMNYQLSCKLSAQLGTKVGIFGNHMESRKAIFDGYGDYATIGAGADAGAEFNIYSEKNDVAFLGEFDLGLAYAINCDWRFTAGYKVLAISGFADASQQTPATYDSLYSAGLINDQSSLILHGAYLGLERTW